MPGFDPFGLEEIHQDVWEKIKSKRPGCAQSDVGVRLVSFIAHGFPGSIFHAHYLDKGIGAIIEEIILDAARDEDIVSDRTFSEDRVDFMIKDRDAYPNHWVKKHRESDLLKQLENDRPKLFYQRFAANGRIADGRSHIREGDR